MSSNQDTAHPAKPAPAVAASRRRPALIAVAGVTLLAGLGYGAWWAFALRHHEATDNAYVQAPVVQITPRSAAPCWPCWPTTPTSSRPASRW